MDAIAENWHPENWDALTLAWFKTPGGAKTLALVKAAPDLLAAIECAKAVRDYEWSKLDYAGLIAALVQHGFKPDGPHITRIRYWVYDLMTDAIVKATA